MKCKNCGKEHQEITSNCCWISCNCGKSICGKCGYAGKIQVKKDLGENNAFGDSGIIDGIGCNNLVNYNEEFVDIEKVIYSLIKQLIEIIEMQDEFNDKYDIIEEIYVRAKEIKEITRRGL